MAEPLRAVEEGLGQAEPLKQSPGPRRAASSSRGSWPCRLEQPWPHTPQAGGSLGCVPAWLAAAEVGSQRQEGEGFCWGRQCFHAARCAKLSNTPAPPLPS